MPDRANHEIYFNSCAKRESLYSALRTFNILPYLFKKIKRFCVDFIYNLLFFGYNLKKGFCKITAMTATPSNHAELLSANHGGSQIMNALRSNHL